MWNREIIEVSSLNLRVASAEFTGFARAEACPPLEFLWKTIGDNLPTVTVG